MSKEKKAAIIGLAAFVVFIIVISIVNKYSSVSSTPKKKCDGSIIIGDEYELGACYDNLDFVQFMRNFGKIFTGEDVEFNNDLVPQTADDVITIGEDKLGFIIRYSNWNVKDITISYSGWFENGGEGDDDIAVLYSCSKMITAVLFAINGETVDNSESMDKYIAISTFYLHLWAKKVEEFPKARTLYYGNTFALMGLSDESIRSNEILLYVLPGVPEMAKKNDIDYVDLNKKEVMDIVYRVYESYANKIVTDTKWEQTTKASSTIEETKSQATENYQKKETKKSSEATVKQNTNKETTKKETQAVETTRAVNKYNYSGTRILLKQGFTYTLTVDSYSDTHAKGSVNVIANDGRQSSIKFDSDISDNCLTCEFANDGRDNSGSLELIFQDKNIYVTITQSYKANISYPEGQLEFTN